MSLPEFGWALVHPFAALKVRHITKTCDAVLKKHPEAKDQLDHFSSGGKLDAFRHVFYMAAYAQKISVKKLRKLGIAHEKGNYKAFKKKRIEDAELADSLGSVMDLQNNELGFRIGSDNKQLETEALQKQVISEINAGKAVVMKRDRAGNYLSCEGKVIDLNLYRNIWAMPKCLVSSGYDPQKH